MPLRTQLVRLVHEEIRRYFRHGLKSSNKTYLPVRPGLPLVGTADAKKRLRRHEQLARIRSETLKPILENFDRRVRDHKLDPSAVGRIVAHDNPLRFGNCYEMSCMAAYLVMKHEIGQAWLGFLTWPGDHVFCLVRDTDAMPYMRDLLDCARQDPDDWVIDPWTNICCPLQMYLFHLVRKFEKWTDQGKFIVYKTPAGRVINILPSREPYRRNTVLAPIVFRRAERVPFRRRPSGR